LKFGPEAEARMKPSGKKMGGKERAKETSNKKIGGIE
jgi:hypothetical protein